MSDFCEDLKKKVSNEKTSSGVGLIGKLHVLSRAKIL